VGVTITTTAARHHGEPPLETTPEAPVITLGVSACFLYPDPSRSVYSAKTLAYLEADMARYLTRDDVMPVLLPDVGDQLESLLDRVDGLVLQGGSDMAPASYGAEPIEGGRWPGDPTRDAYELDLLDRAARRNLPVYGICRGAQVLNVWRGGTLWQDLPSQVGTSGTHRDPEAYDRIHHAVQCVEGGLLAQLYGKTELRVNSIHHQAIHTLGRGLTLEATSPDDGVVEAFSDAGEPFLLGVQWHPEFSPTLGDTVDDAERLLDYFLEVVRRRSG